MNLLRRSINLLSTTIYSHICTTSRSIATPVLASSQLATGPSWAAPGCGSWIQSLVSRGMASLYQMHRTGPHIKKRKSKNPLGGKPFAKGVILKTLIRKPKKPNSANRKCVLVRLSNGKEMTAYVPGIGHNLQEHQIVLVRPGRLQDTPGVKLKCVRGKYDLPHVMKQTH